jgi:hypothetical protein
VNSQVSNRIVYMIAVFWIFDILVFKIFPLFVEMLMIFFVGVDAYLKRTSTRYLAWFSSIVLFIAVYGDVLMSPLLKPYINAPSNLYTSLMLNSMVILMIPLGYYVSSFLQPRQGS